MHLRKPNKSVPHKISELAELKNKIFFSGVKTTCKVGPINGNDNNVHIAPLFFRSENRIFFLLPYY